MPGKYSDAELKARLGQHGWRLLAPHAEQAITGTLKEVLEFMHERHMMGLPRGMIEEIKTNMELDMLQTEQLWRYLGLPT